MLPEYFYHVPASTSGKYHPEFALGEAGLVRHTKVALRILEEMFSNSSFCTYDEYTKDLMRMALMLHDGFKLGIGESSHTVREHPLIMGNFVVQNMDKLSISNEDAIKVSNLIKSHMGPWNTDRDGKEILPKPKTHEELIIHLCDYIASRNFLSVSFFNNEIVDSVDTEKRLELSK